MLYFSRYNRSTVSAGVTGVLTAELDAFIYDGTVLDYLVSQVSVCLNHSSYYVIAVTRDCVGFLNSSYLLFTKHHNRFSGIAIKM